MGKRIGQVFAGITRFPSDSHSLRLYCAVANGAGSQSRPEYPRDQCVPWRERWRAQFQEHTFNRAAAHNHYIRWSGLWYRSGPGHNRVRHQRGRDDLGTLRRRGRCDSRYSALSERRNHRVRRSGRGDRPPAGHSTLQHQPGGRDRGLLQRRERGVSRFPAHSGRCDHYLQRPGCGHSSRPKVPSPATSIR